MSQRKTWNCRTCGKQGDPSLRKPVDPICFECLCKSVGISGYCEACGKKLLRCRIVSSKSSLNEKRKTPSRWCSKKCMGVGISGESHSCWTGGRITSKSGYTLVRHEGKYVCEHRLMMERKLGRKLLKTETVHHKNGDRSDNRIENLELWDGNHGKGWRKADVAIERLALLAESNPKCIVTLGFIENENDEYAMVHTKNGDAVVVPF